MEDEHERAPEFGAKGQQGHGGPTRDNGTLTGAGDRLAVGRFQALLAAQGVPQLRAGVPMRRA